MFLDVYVPSGVRAVLPVETYRKAFAYIFFGSASFPYASPPRGVLTEKTYQGQEYLLREKAKDRSMVLFDAGDAGDEVVIQAGDEGVRFLLISGAPIKVPVAWYGPIVMNTRKELRQAIRELNDGTFIQC